MLMFQLLKVLQIGVALEPSGVDDIYPVTGRVGNVGCSPSDVVEADDVPVLAVLPAITDTPISVLAPVIVL